MRFPALVLPLLLAVGLGAALPAAAGRPLQAEDAGVLEAGACELEVVAARVRVDGVNEREQSLQAGCGIGALGQVAAGVARAPGDDTRTRAVALGGKLALVADTWALAWGFDWQRSGGSGFRHAGSEITLVTSRPLEDAWTLHANLGHSRDHEARAGSTVWALGLEHAGFGPLTAMAELFGDDRSAPWWNVGLRVQLVPGRLDADASYGRQIAPGRPILVTLGLKLAF